MKQSGIKIAPSILAGDFGRLADEAKRAEESGADLLHLDIMDGHFVPNLTMGPKAVAAINRSTDLFLDVHIMIYNPFDFVEKLVESGADRITFHFEATEQIEEVIDYIKRCNVQVGLAFCPETNVEFIPKFLPLVDLILLMTVHPGFGGQAFIPEVLKKIEFVKKAAQTLKLPSLALQVDGGIDDKTAPLCVNAGANVLVAGTYLFKGDDMSDKIQKLKGTT